MPSSPMETEARALGCTCVWPWPGCILTFDRSCPILHLHRRVPPEFTFGQLSLKEDEE